MNDQEGCDEVLKRFFDGRFANRTRWLYFSPQTERNLPMTTPATEQLSPTSLVDTLCEKAQVLLEQNNIDGVEALASEACVRDPACNRGRAFLHAVIGACADYKAEVTDYQINRLHPHPIGCPKIRKHLPDLVETVPCNCEFDLPDGGYPSPLLHIDPAFTAGMGRVDQPQNREVVDRYVTLRQQAAQVMADLSRTEDEMRDILRDRKGKISTGVWVVTADDAGRLQNGKLRIAPAEKRF